MNLPSSIFKAYDIRGIYPSEINEENIIVIVKAIYSFFARTIDKSPLQIVLGRDMRVSSPSLSTLAKGTLSEMGAVVVDIGLVSTPTFYFAVQSGDYDAGIQISASHNPKEYNGVKIVKKTPQGLLKIGKSTGMDEIKRIAESSDFTQPKGEGKVIERNDILDKEINFALSTIPYDFKSFKVVADPANAMGALYLDALFKKIPSELIRMNFELDGTFPAHQPDPLQFDTLKDLQQRVVEEKADLGIAPDGDGDRIFFIDEKGGIITPTLITSLITAEILKKNPRAKIIADIRYTRNVLHICQKYGAQFLVSRVGHAFITEQLNKEKADFAGESSSHFYFKETGGGESSLMVLLYLLMVMSREGKPVSEIVRQYQSSFESTEFNYLREASADPKTMLETIFEDYKDGKVSWLDGLTVDYPTWRFNIRTSNTEPLLRLNVEADTEEETKKELQKLRARLESLGAKAA